MSVSCIKSVVQEVWKRGFDEAKSRIILNIYFRDVPWLSHLTKHTSAKIREVIEKVRRDRYGREKSTEQLALNTNINTITVWRILKLQNFCKTKATHKSSLSA